MPFVRRLTEGDCTDELTKAEAAPTEDELTNPARSIATEASCTGVSSSEHSLSGHTLATDLAGCARERVTADMASKSSAILASMADARLGMGEVGAEVGGERLTRTPGVIEDECIGGGNEGPWP